MRRQDGDEPFDTLLPFAIPLMVFTVIAVLLLFVFKGEIVQNIRAIFPSF